jgi:phospholipase/lecithinase/hemolysin
MRKRNTYRPMIWDVLEERTLPSHGGWSVGPIGVLGDSYSDEYQFAPMHRPNARSWVEILAQTRGTSFGSFSSQFLGEPREKGFEFDWAHDGDTSNDMLHTQLPGLAAQVAQGRVKTVCISIGSNDFNPILKDAWTGRVPPDQALALLAQEEARLESNLDRTVHRLLAASPRVKIVISTLFDLSLMPWVPLSVMGPQGRSLITALDRATQRYNAHIASLAAGNSRIAVADVAGVLAQLSQEASSPGWISYGGTAINLTNAGDDIHHVFLGDRIHFGTVTQGMIANATINALDALGAAMHPLTSEQIVRFARRVPPPTS